VVGFEFPLHQALPRRYRQPRWMPDLDIEDWSIRAELEAAGGRNYDFAIGANGLNTHPITVSSWALMTNVWLDLPVGHLFGGAGGRSFRDLTFNTGVGIGFGRTRIVSANNAAFGAHDENHFVWQVGGEFGLPLSDNITLTAGYRYVPVGNLTNKLTDNTSTQDFGTQNLYVSAHELRTGLRVSFYSVRFPRGLFDARRTRYEP
jgi:opacity protein-like surface antigen